MKKKILAMLSLIMCLLCVALPINAGAEEGVSCSVNSKSASRGETVEFTATLNKSVTVKSGAVSLEYDETVLSLVSAEWKLSAVPSMQPFYPAKGKGAFAYEQATAISGVVFAAQFRVLDNAAFSSTEVKMNLQLHDGAQNPVTVNNEAGSITVVEKVKSASITANILSWNNNNDIVAKLYDASMSDKDIRADMKNGNPTNALAYVSAAKAPVASGKQYSVEIGFENVEVGNYKLAVFKPGKYAVKVVAFEINESSVALGNVKLWLYGDVNYDGKITGADVTQIKRYVTKKSSLFTSDAENLSDRLLIADIDGNGRVAGADATQIKRYTARKSSAFDKLS